MSGCSARLSGRRDDGFTLVEVLIAFGLLAVVMASTVPVLVAMLRSTVITKANTQAKNLGQQRLEQMRDLRFHVDRQNGPFLDLLDIYYTNVSGATTTVATGGGTLTGSYVTSGSVSDGEPALPFYRVTTGPISGATAFSQVIDTQFLTPSGTTVTPTGGYNSQAVGSDLSPSLMVGVTVITNWVYGGRNKAFRTYTRITDGRPQLPVIQSQARAVAVDITSTGADAATLELQAGIVRLDGAQSSGSSVSGYVTGALASRSGVDPAGGLTTQFNLPTTSVTTTGSTSPQSAGGTCSWYGFGKTAVTNADGDVSAGLPNAPANVTAATPPNTAVGSIEAAGGGGCGGLSYDNLAGGGSAHPAVASDLIGYEMGAAPYVKAPDITGSGTSISGSGYVTSNPLTSVPQQTRAGAAATMDTSSSVIIFPNNPESGNRGLVSARLSAASVDCVSGTGAADGTVVGKYLMQLGWWGRYVPLTGTAETAARWHTATWTYNSNPTPASNPVLQTTGDVWDPLHTVLGNGTLLSQLVPTSSSVPAAVGTGATSGLRGFASGIFTLTSVPTLLNESAAGFSGINVQLGQLTCVADDQR